MAVISDIHLGHRRNSATNIIQNLQKAFPRNAETAALDIIFLAGDVFDDLLSLNDSAVTEIDMWIVSFLKTCKLYDIVVVVLEGTPSHDWKQSMRFVTMNELADIGADLKYVQELSIGYIERFAISVLYVPDEWETSTEKTLDQVHALLKAKGLTQVDYAIMHGQFEYQLPAFVKAPKHDSQSYLAIVKELIFIGHVHEHSRFDRILAQGSFDRLSHGTESPKGHLRALVKPNGVREITFVENTGAMVFVTVRCLTMTLEETLDEISRVVMTLPETAMVRIEADVTNPIFTNMEMLVRRHPLITWNKLPRESEKEENVVVDEIEEFVAITLTKENLPGLLLERLAQNGASNAVLTCGATMLKEVLP